LGRVSRDRRKLPIKTPLRDFKVVHPDPTYLSDLESLKVYILEELNVKNLILSSDAGTLVNLRAEPDMSRLGKRLRDQRVPVVNALQALTQEQLQAFLDKGEIDILGNVLNLEDVKVIREFKGDSRYEPGFAADAVTMLDCHVDEELRNEGLAREVINRVQKLRKKANLAPGDPVEIFYAVSAGKSHPDPAAAPSETTVTVEILERAIKTMADYIRAATKIPLIPVQYRSKGSTLRTQHANIDGVTLELWVNSPSFSFDDVNLAKEFSSEPQFVEDVITAVVSRDYFREKANLSTTNGKLTFVLNGRPVELVLGTHFYLSAYERVARLTQ